jgi:GTPase
MKPTADTPIKDLNRAIVLRPLASAAESVRDGEARLLEAVGLAQIAAPDQSAQLFRLGPR